MTKKNYEIIKNQQEIIEAKRLEIRKVKKYKSTLLNKIASISNVYEYLLAPLCAVSMTLVSLFTGPIVYILPTITALGAIGVTAYKLNIKNKIESLDNRIDELKAIRQNAFSLREEAFENIFDNLHNDNTDEKHYYEQILNIRKSCDEINSVIEPYKNIKNKIEAKREKLSKLLTYGLAPISAIVLPIVCSFANVGVIGEVMLMLLSTGSLITCASIDENMTKKVEDLEDVISELKSDRTVKYIQRDIKLNEAIEYLKDKSMIDRSEKPLPINRSISSIIQKDRKQENSKGINKKD